MTPAAVLAGVPDDVLRVGDSLNARQRQAIRLERWFEQKGHRPTWAEIEAERARRTTFTNERTHRRVIRRSTTPNGEAS